MNFPKKIIFLDIDGVLNSRQWYMCENGKIGKGNIDPENVRVLKELVEETGAEIVLASSWRSYADIFERFHEFTGGLDLRFVLNPFMEKDDALKDFIQTYKGRKYSYVIIDDELNEYPSFGDEHIVVTDWETGLTERHKNEAVSKLLL